METEYLQAIFNLLIVLVLIFGLIYLIKKFKYTKHAGDRHITIKQVVPLGSKEKVILLEVNNSLILLGATANHIETLHVFDEMPVDDKFLLKFDEQSEYKIN